jgi:small-conductance mechanosensitive channel
MDLHRVIFGNTIENWLHSFALAAALWLGFWIVRKICAKYLGVIGEKRHNPIYETLSDLTQRTKLLFLLLVSVSVAIRPLTLPPAIDRIVDRALIIATVIQVGMWGGAFLRLWIEPYLSKQIGHGSNQTSTLAAVSLLLRAVFYSLLVIWGLDNLGINVSALVAGLGVGGIAVALATQNILGDLFSSLSITLDQPFQVGDSVTVDTFTGTIEKIGLKTTRMRSESGEQLIFSNTDLLSSRIRNNRRMSEKRTLIVIGVTYDTPPEKLRKIPQLLEQAASGQPLIRFDRAHIRGLGASAIEFEFIFWMAVKPERSHLDQQQEIILRVVENFNKAGIEFAYPTQTVYVAGTGGDAKASPLRPA